MRKKFNIKSKPALLVSLGFVMLACAFSSCLKDNNNGGDNSLNVAGMIVTNAAASLDPQDVFFDSQKGNANPLAYMQTLGYFSVTGTPTINFKDSNTGTLTASAGTNFAIGKYYSVFLTDDKAISIYDIDRTTPPSGKARIRFINLTAAPGSSVDIGLKGGTKIITALTYKSASAYQTVDVTNSFSLYAGGASSVLLDLPVILQSGAVYTLYISGTTNTTLNYKTLIEN